MTDTKKAKDIGDVTSIPSGLDVVPSVPGTYIGGHDMQGADGDERTDRPGEILGTAIAPDESRTSARAKEGAKHDYVTAEVDRANREELPKLGGAIDDNWEPGDSKGSKAKTAATAPVAAPVARATPAAPAQDSGVKVSPKIDR